jgi:hypothetical protein
VGNVKKWEKKINSYYESLTIEKLQSDLQDAGFKLKEKLDLNIFTYDQAGMDKKASQPVTHPDWSIKLNRFSGENEMLFNENKHALFSKLK